MAALEYLKSESEFRDFPSQRFVNFELTRPPTYISVCPPPSKTLADGTKVWRLAESEADKLRGEPRSVRYPDIEERLAAHPFLKGMSPHHLELLALCAMPTEFEAGQIVLRKAMPPAVSTLLKPEPSPWKQKRRMGNRWSSILSRPANRSGGHGFFRPISGRSMRVLPSRAAPFVFRESCCGSIATTISLSATNCTGAPAK